MVECIGHWEGKIIITKKTTIIIDIFDDEVLLGFPELRILGLKGKYYFSKDIFNVYLEMIHPITINSNIDFSAKRMHGVIAQEKTNYDFYVKKTPMRPIFCGLNDRYGFYKCILYNSPISEKQYSIATDDISYECIHRDIRKQILNYYNVTPCDDFKLENLIRLMDVVHNKFNHSPDFTTDFSINTISIINKKIKKINCRAYAILFNELALAIGYKSRYVTCLPYRDWENECHVVNEVYVEELQKWIMIDANMGTLIKDPSGECLNILEYREALVYDKKCDLIDTASYNGRNVSIEEYNTYMVKNMYKFEYKLKYEFDSEKNRRVQLMPNL